MEPLEETESPGNTGQPDSRLKSKKPPSLVIAIPPPQDPAGRVCAPLCSAFLSEAQALNAASGVSLIYSKMDQTVSLFLLLDCNYCANVV